MRTIALWTVLAAFLGFAIGGSFVWSIQQAPKEQSEAGKQCGEHRSTSEGPCQDDVAKPFGEALSVLWDRTWEDPVAFYTFILSVFTAVLGIATVATLVLGVLQILLSRREFHATHRPRLTVHAVEPWTDVWENENTGQRTFTLGAGVVYFNTGESPMIVTEIMGQIERHDFPLPSSLDLTFSQRIGARNKPLASGARERFIVPSKLDPEHLKALQRTDGAKITNYFCIGRITYRDEAGISRQAGYCWRYDASGQRWLRVEGSEYNYAY